MSVIVIFATGIGILSRTARQQDEMLAGLQKEKMELDELRAENKKLKTIQVDAAELIRLRQENAELPKLRNEVWQLRETMQPQDSQEAEAITQLANENEQLQQQKQELQELPDRATCIKNLEMIDAAKTPIGGKKWIAGRRPYYDGRSRALFPRWDSGLSRWRTLHCQPDRRSTSVFDQRSFHSLNDPRRQTNYRRNYFVLGTTIMPHGLEPAFTRAISFSVARSTAETSSDGPFIANKYFPSGENAMPHGSAPTLMVLSSSQLFASSTHT